MTPEERLEQIIFDEDIFLGSIKLTSAKGVYLIQGTNEYIILSADLETVEEKVDTLAHELGHHYAGLSMKKSYLHALQDEHLADRWVAENIITPERLVAYQNKGCDSLEDLREHFGFSNKYFNHLLEIKSHIHYPYCKYKNNIITFQPFSISKNIV